MSAETTIALCRRCFRVQLNAQQFVDSRLGPRIIYDMKSVHDPTSHEAVPANALRQCPELMQHRALAQGRLSDVERRRFVRSLDTRVPGEEEEEKGRNFRRNASMCSAKSLIEISSSGGRWRRSRNERLKKTRADFGGRHPAEGPKLYGTSFRRIITTLHLLKTSSYRPALHPVVLCHVIFHLSNRTGCLLHPGQGLCWTTSVSSTFPCQGCGSEEGTLVDG